MDLQRMIRADGYKLIVYPGAGVVKLFHVEEDELELKDLSADPGQQARIRQMYSDLQLLMQDMGDTLILPALN